MDGFLIRYQVGIFQSFVVYFVLQILALQVLQYEFNQKQERNSGLAAIIAGESVLNSAVAIILFGTIKKIDEEDSLNWATVFSLIWPFFYLFLTSLALGIFFGFALSFLFKKIESFTTVPIKQSSLILLTGYFSYLTGELVGLSGIIVLFTASIVFGQYGFNNLSEESKKGTSLAFQTVRYLAQAFVFAYLGASLLGVEGQWSAVGMGIAIVFLIPLIRFLMLLPLSRLFKTLKLSTKDLKMMWYTGLSRGVIAFALSLQVNSPQNKEIITVALVVVMLSTLITVTFSKTFADYIGFGVIENLIGVNQAIKTEFRQNLPSSRYGMIGHEQIQNAVSNSGTFESKFIKPLFTKSSKGQEIQLQNKKMEVVRL